MEEATLQCTRIASRTVQMGNAARAWAGASTPLPTRRRVGVLRLRRACAALALEHALACAAGAATRWQLAAGWQLARLGGAAVTRLPRAPPTCSPAPHALRSPTRRSARRLNACASPANALRRHSVSKWGSASRSAAPTSGRPALRARTRGAVAMAAECRASERGRGTWRPWWRGGGMSAMATLRKRRGVRVGFLTNSRQRTCCRLQTSVRRGLSVGSPVATLGPATLVVHGMFHTWHVSSLSKLPMIDRK